jgi:hypothetical protein
MKNISIILLCLFSISANAQDPCEGIDFLTISYNAFTDTSIIVHLTNTGSEGFSYPGFILINTAGDTFAMESVNFFGIGQESIHSLEIRPGVMDSADIFDGTLELHTGFYDSLWCSWPINQSFCPPENCTNITIGMQNLGGELVVGDFEYSLNNSQGNTIETGTYTMVDTIQYWEDTLCVPFGEYTYTVNALGITSGGGPVITVSQFGGYGSPTLNEYFDWYNGTSMNVPFHTQCEPEEPNSIQTPGIKEGFTIVYNRDKVQISCDSNIIGVEVYNMKGQLIKHVPITDSTTDISSGLSSGVHVALARFASGKTGMKKFVIR